MREKLAIAVPKEIIIIIRTAAIHHALYNIDIV